MINLRFSAGETIYSLAGRPAITLTDTPYHEPVNLRWLDGETDRVLPECVESAQQHQQRIDASKHHRQQQAEPVSVRDAWRW